MSFHNFNFPNSGHTLVQFLKNFIKILIENIIEYIK